MLTIIYQRQNLDIFFLALEIVYDKFLEDVPPELSILI